MLEAEEKWLAEGNLTAAIVGCDACLRKAVGPQIKSRALRLKAAALLRVNSAFRGKAISALRDALLLASDPVEKAQICSLLTAAHTDPELSRPYALQAEALVAAAPRARTYAVGAWLNMGYALHMLGSLREAEGAYLQALQLSAAEADTAGVIEHNMAEVLLEAGRMEEARTWAGRAETKLGAPYRSSFLELQARLAWRSGDLSTALQLVQEAMGHPSANDKVKADALLTRARVLLAMGDFDGTKAAALEAWSLAGTIGYVKAADEAVTLLSEEAGRSCTG